MDWACVLNDPKLISKFLNIDFKEKNILKLVYFFTNLCTIILYLDLFIYILNDVMINCNKM